MFEYTPDDIIFININVGETGKLLNKHSLESVFSSIDYQPDTLHKIASVTRSIMQNHPFVDGNKRTGISFMFGSIDHNNVKVNHKTDEEIVKFAQESVTQRYSVEQIVHWLKH